MPRDPLVYLWDVREACDAVIGFVSSASYETFLDSPMMQAAVERKLEIIGEAMSQLRKLDAELAAKVPEIEKIIGFRNILVHAYHAVDYEVVWRIIHTSVPPLRETAASLLDE